MYSFKQTRGSFFRNFIHKQFHQRRLWFSCFCIKCLDPEENKSASETKQGGVSQVQQAEKETEEWEKWSQVLNLTKNKVFDDFYLRKRHIETNEGCRGATWMWPEAKELEPDQSESSLRSQVVFTSETNQIRHFERDTGAEYLKKTFSATTSSSGQCNKSTQPLV